MNKKNDVADVFRGIRQREYDSRLTNISGSYRFDIRGGGSWFIDVERGRVSIMKKKADALCVIGCTNQDFLKIARGKQNLLTAALQGRITISGDLALAQKLYALTRSKPKQNLQFGENT